MSTILSGSWAAAAPTDKARANPAIAIELCNIDLCNMCFLPHSCSNMRTSGLYAPPSRPLQSFDCRPRAARLAADGRARPFGDAGLDAEGVVERIPWPRNVRRGRRLFVMTDIVPDQAARHAKLGIGLKVRVVVGIDLRNVRLESRLVDQEMQMRRAHVGAALGAQEIAHRPVDRYRIAGRLDAAERDVTVGIGGGLAAPV